MSSGGWISTRRILPTGSRIWRRQTFATRVIAIELTTWFTRHAERPHDGGRTRSPGTHSRVARVTDGGSPMADRPTGRVFLRHRGQRARVPHGGISTVSLGQRPPNAT